MTAEAYQGAVALLVTDRKAREGFSKGDVPPDLSAHEQAQIRRLAADSGILLTAKLIASFRLGKLLALTPMTRAVLGNERLAAEVHLFWDAHPPTSFYFPDEALEFCDFLDRRISSGQLNVPMLDRIVELERQSILAQRPSTTHAQRTRERL